MDISVLASNSNCAPISGPPPPKCSGEFQGSSRCWSPPTPAQNPRIFGVATLHLWAGLCGQPSPFDKFLLNSNLGSPNGLFPGGSASVKVGGLRPQTFLMGFSERRCRLDNQNQLRKRVRVAPKGSSNLGHPGRRFAIRAVIYFGRGGLSLEACRIVVSKSLPVSLNTCVWG